MRSFISASLMAGFLCVIPFAAQADDAKASDCNHNQILAESLDKSSCYGQGDKAPDQYIREELAIKDFKAKGLPAPADQEQWVDFGKHYVLVSRTNSVIKEIRTHTGKVVTQ